MKQNDFLEKNRLLKKCDRFVLFCLYTFTSSSHFKIKFSVRTNIIIYNNIVNIIPRIEYNFLLNSHGRSV